jgi:hypothetical protein
VDGNPYLWLFLRYFLFYFILLRIYLPLISSFFLSFYVLFVLPSVISVSHVILILYFCPPVHVTLSGVTVSVPHPQYNFHRPVTITLPTCVQNREMSSSRVAWLANLATSLTFRELAGFSSALWNFAALVVRNLSFLLPNQVKITEILLTSAAISVDMYDLFFCTIAI